MRFPVLCRVLRALLPTMTKALREGLATVLSSWLINEDALWEEVLFLLSRHALNIIIKEATHAHAKQQAQAHAGTLMERTAGVQRAQQETYRPTSTNTHHASKENTRSCNKQQHTAGARVGWLCCLTLALADLLPVQDVRITLFFFSVTLASV